MDLLANEHLRKLIPVKVSAAPQITRTVCRNCRGLMGKWLKDLSKMRVYDGENRAWDYSEIAAA